MDASRRSELFLTGLILGGMVLAVLYGLAAREVEVIGATVPWLTWTGVLFKQLLLVIIYPLVLASMVVGVVDLGDVRKVGGIAVPGIVYFMCTTAIAVVIGLVLVNAFEPGAGVELGAAAAPEVKHANFGAFFLDMLKNTFKNPFASLAGGDVLAIIAFGLLLGTVTSTMGDEGRPVADFFRSLNAALMRLTGWVMWLAPVGVFGLLLDVIVAQGAEVLWSLKSYVVTVVVALGVHGLLVLPLIAWFVGGVPPWRFFRGVGRALLVAFSTASSAATLPTTIACAEESLEVREDVAGFILPLGATINMDGTALYEAIAAMFIAQAYGIDLSMGEQVVVFLTAMAAAVGAAGIPSAGLITMALVLTAVGLPLEGIGLILAVDRVLDMLRTTVNVSGDATGAVVLNRITAR